jgi:hypothetical protein
MPRLKWFGLALAFLGTSALCPAETAPSKRVPVLLELFTSEGCSSCPPADKLLAAFDQKQPVTGADLIVLSEHVDYWNDGGWRDPFSASQYTERQQIYTDKLHGEGPYTPQLVIDGRAAVVGSNAQQAISAIQRAITEQKIPITLADASHHGNEIKAHVTLNATQFSSEVVGGTVYIAVAVNEAESQVAHGENAGRSLSHVAVALLLKKVGTVKLGSVFSYDVSVSIRPEAAAKPLRLVAFLQDQKSGQILGVAALKL